MLRRDVPNCVSVIFTQVIETILYKGLCESIDVLNTCLEKVQRTDLIRYEHHFQRILSLYKDTPYFRKVESMITEYVDDAINYKEKQVLLNWLIKN